MGGSGRTGIGPYSADVRVIVLMQSYACNSKSIGYLMWLVKIAYGAATIMGLIVHILSEEGRMT
jgi:hypothetical protein